MASVLLQAVLGCPRSPCTVALVYHGEYHRGTWGAHDYDWTGVAKCADFFSAAHNQFVNIVQPLQSHGAVIRTVFHTYSSGCALRDEALVRFLAPVAYECMRRTGGLQL